MNDEQFQSNIVSIRKLPRKNTFRTRDSHKNQAFQEQYLKNYTINELKMLVMIGLIKKFSMQRERILLSYNKQTQQKLSKTGRHFNRTSSTLVIQPIKKQIRKLNQTALILQPFSESIFKYLKKSSKRPSMKKLNSYKSLNILASCLDSILNIEQTQKFHTNKKLTLQQNPQNKITQEYNQKQNIDQQKKKNVKINKKYLSDLSFISKTMSTEKQLSQIERRNKFYEDKKKQQINFLKKISAEFNSQQSQFKVLMETIQIFAHNLNRANYYLKMIDQDEVKCGKIIAYINDLNKIFQNILESFQSISKLHPSLILKQTNMRQTVKYESTKYLPSIQDYYKKSEKVAKLIRHFSLSPTFSAIIPAYHKQCVKIVKLFVQSRYTLRYLQKQIESIQNSNKKQNINLSKWQKAYRVKFLPKNAFS